MKNENLTVALAREGIRILVGSLDIMMSRGIISCRDVYIVIATPRAVVKRNGSFDILLQGGLTLLGELSDNSDLAKLVAAEAVRIREKMRLSRGDFDLGKYEIPAGATLRHEVVVGVSGCSMEVNQYIADQLAENCSFLCLRQSRGALPTTFA